jgi:pyruvate dehydrogenase E2 component (dihydrolipoamide acetyltransferase)
MPLAAAARELPDFSRFGEVEREPMSKIRRVTARNMAAAWNTVPHVTQNDVADVTELEAARKRYGKKAEAAGGKLTMTAILLKVCASALRAFPDFNASIDAAADEIVYKKYVNIGVAVDTDRGLLVPVIRDVDKKNIIALAVELNDVAEKARSKKVTPDMLEGGNFTVSNLGGIGGTSFSPIVYHPEVAILGVSRATKRPVWRDEGFVPRLMLPLSLSYDHRLIDGAAAARFARWVAEALENPILLALEG